MRIVMAGAGMIEIPPPAYGAVEKHIWNLSKALRARGHEVRIVNRVFGRASKDEYRFALWARKEVAREPYDVLHLHTPGVAAVFRALGPRHWVYTTHSRHWSTVEGLGERVGFALEKRAVAAAAETIAVSRLVAERISRPVHVIPNGVEVARYRALPEARTGRVVVGLGEIAEHKRWHLVAEATRDTGAQFRLVGPVRDVAYLTRVEAAGPHVKILGALDEEGLVDELARADLLAHPSVSESFGMALVEGMSAGLPVVCSDFLSFLVRNDKEGLLVPTGGDDARRVETLRSAITRLMDDEPLRRRLGESARARAAEAFSWERVAEQVETVYRRLAA